MVQYGNFPSTMVRQPLARRWSWILSDVGCGRHFVNNLRSWQQFRSPWRCFVQSSAWQPSSRCQYGTSSNKNGRTAYGLGRNWPSALRALQNTVAWHICLASVSRRGGTRVSGFTYGLHRLRGGHIGGSPWTRGRRSDREIERGPGRSSVRGISCLYRSHVEWPTESSRGALVLLTDSTNCVVGRLLVEAALIAVEMGARVCQCVSSLLGSRTGTALTLSAVG